MSTLGKGVFLLVAPLAPSISVRDASGLRREEPEELAVSGAPSARRRDRRGPREVTEQRELHRLEVDDAEPLSDLRVLRVEPDDVEQLLLFDWALFVEKAMPYSDEPPRPGTYDVALQLASDVDTLKSVPSV